MWLLALALVADTVHAFSLALSPAESVAVTMTGTGDPVVLVPGLFGSVFLGEQRDQNGPVGIVGASRIGGQIFPAIWEAIKKRGARLLGRPDPGPVDVAKLMPVAYVVALVFIAWSGLLLVADVINPVRLFQ